MKDYRSFERIDVDDWEEDKEWLGNRLDFLWSIRDYNTELYFANDLHLEKHDFYEYNDYEVINIASSRHYSVDVEKYNNMYRNTSIEDQYNIYQKLRRLKASDLKEFMKKNNCNLYDYFLDKDSQGYFSEL